MPWPPPWVVLWLCPTRSYPPSFDSHWPLSISAAKVHSRRLEPTNAGGSIIDQTWKTLAGNIFVHEARRGHSRAVGLLQPLI